jgi:hypothetical protein
MTLLFGLAFALSVCFGNKQKRRNSFFGYFWLVWLLLVTATYGHSIFAFDYVELPISFNFFVTLLFSPISIIANFFGLLWLRNRYLTSKQKNMSW